MADEVQPTLFGDGPGLEDAALLAKAPAPGVERADLSRIYVGIRAVEGGSGRTAIAPEILFTLWLYATLEGVGTARELARLTQAHDAYRWICGGVQVNYHSLSDFRNGHTEALDGLLTDSVAALMAAGAVTLKRVAQDGRGGTRQCRSGLVSARGEPGALSVRRRARKSRPSSSSARKIPAP